MNKLAKSLILAILAVKASAATDGPPPDLAKMGIETESPGADSLKWPTDITVEQFDAAFSNVGESGGRKRWSKISNDQWMLEVESVDKVLNMRTSYRFVFVFDPSRSSRALFARMVIDSVDANKADRYQFIDQVKFLLAKLNESKPYGPAPIDNKNEHLGLRLGSSRRELKYQVFAEDTKACVPFRDSDRRDLQQLEARQTDVDIVVPPGFVFGNIRIASVTLYYVADRLCEIKMRMPNNPADLQVQQYQQAMNTLYDALVAKYGEPRAADRDVDKSSAKWEGADVYLGFRGIGANQYLSYSRFGPSLGCCVVLGSKKVLQAAEQEFLKKSQSQQDDSKKKAQELKDKI